MGTDNNNGLWIMVGREADFFRALLRRCLSVLENPTAYTQQERDLLAQEITTALDENNGSDDPFACEGESVDDPDWFDSDTYEV
ncbi:MAG TPA: hypothetical protein VFB38_14265 [Chthonomonadaceae bacterium]|nr:hypothetical protein [Chthonomonadaceae bacterium]